ncbi:hypothetical protein [Herbiconiux daphne]|uniref:Nucleotide exchange factor GrpE n=1 Tax=Herbiconiux daphne TaxID=2970914 RepID=A0ABT2GXJ3_9MICO|nr:hypothetical protein [Herbiconiux daphne]MCS5732652.1 hypothetical protein [Herbiconiux daphne]
MDALAWLLGDPRSAVTAAVAVVLLVVAVVLAVLLARASSRSPQERAGQSRAAVPAPTQAPASGPAASAAPPAAVAASVPDGLVRDLIALADLSTTPAVSAQCARILRGVGVEPVVPGVDQPLAPGWQHVVGVVAAPDAAHEGLVASTVRPGYRSGATLVRQADVFVYQHAANGSAR